MNLLKPKRQRHCKRCHDLFMPDPRSKGSQRYCSKEECQRYRQNKNRDDWYKKHPDCLEYRKSLTRRWFNERPGYSSGRRKHCPSLAAENKHKTRLRMKNMRQKTMFDKTKSILTQSIGVKEDKCFLIRRRTWVLACLTKRSRLKAADLWCKTDGAGDHDPAGGAGSGYRLSETFQ